ncbi:MAG: single-stranded DNA-binding protein [Bacillota bacterium]|nr:single-stranded DNA-binding protein [Bacillota bacterium]
MLNKAIIIGNLVQDCSLRYTPTGVAVANFTLAVQRNFKNSQGEREADFIPVVAYKQLAEVCANYLDKGKKCCVEGRIQTRNYTNKDGQKVYITELIANEVEFLSPKDSSLGHEVDNSDAPF